MPVILHQRAVVVLLIASASASLAGQHESSTAGHQLVDLTHPFDEDTIFWPTEAGFRLEKGPAGITPQGYYYAANRFYMAEHGGTHIDAPIHFHQDRQTVDQIPLGRLVGPGVVVDVTRQCAKDRDYLVSVDDLLAWEQQHQSSLERTIVLLHTGFGKHWPDRQHYLGTRATGRAAVAQLRFPGLDPAAALWLARRRSIRAVGIDTASIDHGQSTRFEAHVRLCEHNVPALENVARLDQLPPRGFTVMALPIKIAGGTGGPCRIVAMVPQHRLNEAEP